jgi:hypothetical protein
MDKIRSGCVEMQWSPDTRLCFVRYHDGPKATAEDGRKLVASITGWIGPQPKPFAILVDGGKIQGGQPGYRGVMGAFFKIHKAHVKFALFDLGPVLRIAAEMFALGASLRLRTFGTEAEAREWLRKEGVQA